MSCDGYQTCRIRYHSSHSVVNILCDECSVVLHVLFLLKFIRKNFLAVREITHLDSNIKINYLLYNSLS